MKACLSPLNLWHLDHNVLKRSEMPRYSKNAHNYKQLCAAISCQARESRRDQRSMRNMIMGYGLGGYQNTAMRPLKGCLGMENGVVRPVNIPKWKTWVVFEAMMPVVISWMKPEWDCNVSMIRCSAGTSQNFHGPIPNAQLSNLLEIHTTLLPYYHNYLWTYLFPYSYPATSSIEVNTITAQWLSEMTLKTHLLI